MYTFIDATLLLSKIPSESGRFQWDPTSNALCSGDHIIYIYIYILKKAKKIKNCQNHIIASAVSDSVLCLDEDTGIGVTLRASVSIYK